MLLSFDARDDAPGVSVTDHVERRQCTIRTPSAVEPTDAPVDAFRFPVDRGVAITTDSLLLPHTMSVCVRNQAGWMIAQLANGESRTLPADRYSIELCAPIKLYTVVESPLTVSVTADRVAIELAEPTEVLLGARSHHEHPAATITSTTEPTDMMEAVSYFGSALKTATCERSYPTLRGHPPTVELGDELRVPSILSRPETGVWLELPPDHRSIYVASSLAYYLGATLRPAETPRIRTETGFVHPLDDPGRGFVDEVQRVLKQTFFLDCLTRTEGYYQVNLHERNELEGTLGLDFESLYDRPVAEQLEAYLDVPYPLIAPHVPQWKLTATVAVDPRHVEMLPFVVNDLAAIRPAESLSVGGAGFEMGVAGGLERGSEFTRSAATRSTDTVDTPALIQPEETSSLEHAWIGEGAPIGASKAIIQAFRNRLDRTAAEGNIEITVVCNDLAMEAERDLVDEIYGSRDELPFDVTAHHELTAAELRAVLREDVDFLHYIGHIDSHGFECRDEPLDAATLDSTGVDAFFLNACSSYRQGLNLIEAGSIAGVVTLQDVINSGAERVGKTLARLLNRGFPLRAALDIAKDQSLMGGHYLVIGDGGLDIAQPDGTLPSKCKVRTENDNTHIVEYQSYVTSSRGMGTISLPHFQNNQEYYLAPGIMDEFEIKDDELKEFFSQEIIPVEMNGEFCWSDELV